MSKRVVYILMTLVRGGFVFTGWDEGGGLNKSTRYGNSRVLLKEDILRRVTCCSSTAFLNPIFNPM